MQATARSREDMSTRVKLHSASLRLSGLAASELTVPALALVQGCLIMIILLIQKPNF